MIGSLYWLIYTLAEKKKEDAPKKETGAQVVTNVLSFIQSLSNAISSVSFRDMTLVGWCEFCRSVPISKDKSR